MVQNGMLVSTLASQYATLRRTAGRRRSAPSGDPSLMYPATGISRPIARPAASAAAGRERRCMLHGLYECGTGRSNRRFRTIDHRDCRGRGKTAIGEHAQVDQRCAVRSDHAMNAPPRLLRREQREHVVRTPALALAVGQCGHMVAIATDSSTKPCRRSARARRCPRGRQNRLPMRMASSSPPSVRRK